MTDLIAIPGLGSDSAIWSRTIDALGARARCAVGDTLQDHSLEAIARRILGDAPPTFALAGVSMGGMVALEIMRAEPHRVSALALIDSNAFPDTAAQAENRRRGIAAMRSGADIRAASETSLAWLVHPQAAVDVRHDLVEMGIRVGAETYARQSEAVLNRPDQRPLLTAIRIPTLVLNGADDVMIPTSRAREMADLIDNAEFEVIPDCGHLPPIEQPRATADALASLLARLN